MQSLSLRYRVFSISYVPATNTLPCRVRIKDMRRNKTKIISYGTNNEPGEDLEITARKYLLSLGIECQALAMSQNDFSLLSEDFMTPLS